MKLKDKTYLVRKRSNDKNMKIAINGFGRIGRAAMKIALANPNVEVVAINDLGELDNLVYLLQYDTVYGVYEHKVRVQKDFLVVGKNKIKVFSEKDPAQLPWGQLGVDVVLECTGVFLDKEGCQKHIEAGARKVVISAPAKDDTIKTVVIGCNEKTLTKQDTIISMASCTTNCIAPMMKILDSVFKVEKSLMSTIHSYTATQMLVDGPGGKKDMRRGRAAALNIVPSTTGAAKAATLTLPQLKKKFDGMAFRVPTAVGSISDVVVVTKKTATIESINAAFEKAAKKELKKIMQVTYEPLVSSDIIGNPHSVIMQLDLTNVVKDNLVKVVGWYDNEWGYSNRLVEMALLIAKK